MAGTGVALAIWGKLSPTISRKKDDTRFKQFNAPIFQLDIDAPLTRYEQKNAGFYTPQYDVNICLKTVQFYKFKDGFTTFQYI